ncbi:hypothetical protein TNCV_2707721 [Trichonephila clavipes]|nr:hypothetical protein TNCV_2707721 [Trichonephila clavipes]
MNSTPSITNAASVVAQSKKYRTPGLGRGPGSIYNLRSSKFLKIMQFNINGISTSASRIKLDQVLELALTEGSRIIALQEINLKTFNSLKIKGYNIFSRDFRINEFEALIGDSCLNKSPGPDGIHCQMVDYIGLRGRQRFLDIINCSLNKRQLPRDWRRATVIPIRKCCKNDGTPDSFRPIAL